MERTWRRRRFWGSRWRVRGPFISQTILAKDDLPLAAFLVAAMVGLSGERLRDRLGVSRLGVAVGLMLATKFTAVFSLPAILLAIDAPWRGGVGGGGSI